MRDAVATSEAPTGEGMLVLGRYRPLRPLGSGGSGSVWLVRDEQAGREVALKVVRREGNAGSRAEREVEAAARLRHRHCLRALDLHRDDGHVYVAYEYVHGRTLREALRAGEVGDEAAVEAVAQVLEAIGHAHGKGVVHRDVKPSNVMLEEGDDVRVRLLDFGLAHVDDADTLTAAGDVPGTLAYVAPERLEGEAVSGAADVWAVGVILWEALAGWHPFAGPSPVETARRISSGAPPLARTRPDLPSELCALVHRMLDRDPRRRPAPRRLAGALREAADVRARRPRAASSRRVLRERAVHAVLAGGFTTTATLVLPFFPRGWPFALGAVAAVAALRAPRVGLALALAAPALPLANVALGLGLAYCAVALVWLGLFARDAVNGLLFFVGALLAPAGGIGLAPVLALRARGALRPVLVAAFTVVAAAALAAAADLALPLSRQAAPSLGIAETERPGTALGAVLAALAANPVLVFESLALGVAAALVPVARRRGLWGVSIWGSSVLATTLLVPSLAGLGDVSALQLAPGVVLGTAWLGAVTAGVRR
jgi:hypothetical protein